MKQDPGAFWRRYTKPLGSQAWALQQFYVARWFGIFITCIAAVFVLVSAFTKLITAPLEFIVDAIGGAGAYLFAVFTFFVFRSAARLPGEGNSFLFIPPSDETIRKATESWSR